MQSPLKNDSDHQFLAVALAVGFASLSLLASCLTLYLIKRLAKWNGYIQLVVSLTVCQIIYDISFFFLPLDETWGQYLYVFLNTFGGLTSSLWSNVIIMVTARIVIRLRTVDTLKLYRRYFAVVMIPSSVVALATLIFFDHNTYEDYVIISYFAIRCASIALNLAAIAVIFFNIYLMNRGQKQTLPSASSVASATAATAANSGSGGVDHFPTTSTSGHSHSSHIPVLPLRKSNSTACDRNSEAYTRRSSHDRVYSSSHDHSGTHSIGTGTGLSGLGGGRSSSCSGAGAGGRGFRESLHARQAMTTQQNVLSARNDSTTTTTTPPFSSNSTTTNNHNNNNLNNSNSNHNHNSSNPVFLLSKRLVYYCVVQTVARIGSSWYQLAYGFGDDAEYDASDASPLKTSIYLSEFILNPSAGIGYLLVFLVIQPEAWAELRGMLGCACACAFCCKGKRRKKRRKKRKGVQQPVGNREHEAEDLYVERCHAESSLYSGSNSDSHHSHLQHSGSHSHSSSARCQVEARIGRTIAPDEEDSVSEEGNGEGDSCSEGSSEDEIDTTPRDSSYTVSSSDSSMFPLLDNMTEDDLAREIERRYNPQNHSSGAAAAAGLLSTAEDQKTPLLQSW